MIRPVINLVIFSHGSILTQSRETLCNECGNRDYDINDDDSVVCQHCGAVQGYGEVAYSLTDHVETVDVPRDIELNMIVQQNIGSCPLLGPRGEKNITQMANNKLVNEYKTTICDEEMVTRMNNYQTIQTKFYTKSHGQTSIGFYGLINNQTRVPAKIYQIENDEEEVRNDFVFFPKYNSDGYLNVVSDEMNDDFIDFISGIRGKQRRYITLGEILEYLNNKYPNCVVNILDTSCNASSPNSDFGKNFGKGLFRKKGMSKKNRITRKKRNAKRKGKGKGKGKQTRRYRKQ